MLVPHQFVLPNKLLFTLALAFVGCRFIRFNRELFMDKQGSPTTQYMLVRSIDRLLILPISLPYTLYFPPAVHYKSSNNTLSIAPILFARNPLGKVLGIATLLAHSDDDWCNNHFPILHVKLLTRPLPRTVAESSYFFCYVHSLSKYATSYRQP